MKWVTRERPVIDRIACPWLIARFIDKGAEFLFVPPDRVLSVAKETGATPYDVPGVEFSHVGDGCSFDAFVSKYGLGRDPAITTIAAIVRGADTGRHDLTPQSAGTTGDLHGSTRRDTRRSRSAEARLRHLRCALRMGLASESGGAQLAAHHGDRALPDIGRASYFVNCPSSMTVALQKRTLTLPSARKPWTFNLAQKTGGPNDE